MFLDSYQLPLFMQCTCNDVSNFFWVDLNDFYFYYETIIIRRFNEVL